jgi:inosine/xanthosine triphosphate pyrophosphatase family protein
MKEMNDIVSIISAVGFPIVAAVGCGYCVIWQYEQNQKQMDEVRKEHKEEVSKMTEALNNNTLALQKLIDKIDKE